MFVHILWGMGLLPTPSRLNAVMFDSNLLLIGIALLGSIRTMLLSRIRLMGIALKRLLVVLHAREVFPALDLGDLDIQVRPLLLRPLALLELDISIA